MSDGFTRWQCCLLSALISLAAVASCLYSPALPMMAHSVGRSISALQFLIVANLIGHSLGPLFYGIAANRFGRLPTIRMGLGLTIVGAALCALASPLANFQCLCIGCVVLTLGANVGLTLVLTMIKDHAVAARRQQLTALVLISFAILPGLAVLLGSLLLTTLPWWWLFITLIAYCLLLLIGSRFLPETAPLKMPALLSFRVLTHARFWLTCGLLACVTGCFYTFNAQIPRIALSVLHLDLLRFGLYSNIPSLGMLIGSMSAIVLAKSQAPLSNVRTGLTVALSVAILMVLYCLCVTPSVLSLFVFVGALNIGLQILFPAAATLALAHSDNTASAASFLAIINSAVAGVFVSLGNLWPSSSYVSLSLCDAAILLVALVLYERIKR